MKIVPITKAASTNKQTIIDHATTLIKTALNERYYNFTSARRIATQWYESKRHLIDLFSTYPQWNSENFFIQYETTLDTLIDGRALTQTCREISNMIGRRDVCGVKDMKSFLSDMSKHTSPVIDSAMSSLLKNQYGIDAPAGKKTTKVMRQVLDLCGFPQSRDIPHYVTINWTDSNTGEYHERIVNHGLQWLVSKYADILNPPQHDETFFLSLNPVDYLYMSNGTTWHSCHDIKTHDDDIEGDAGCYHSGVLSYLRDSSTVILYTLSKNDRNHINDGTLPISDVPFYEKATRQCIHINTPNLSGDMFPAFVSSRIYPQGNDRHSDLYRVYRNVTQGIMSMCYNIPNHWQVKKGNNIVDYITYHTDNRAYEDLYQSYNTYFSISYHGDINDMRTFFIGAAANCINCNDVLYEESMYCESCLDDYKYVATCCYCEQGLREDNLIIACDNTYCNDECAYNDGYVYVPSLGEYESVDDVLSCEYCGEYVYCVDATILEHDDYDEYFCCESCKQHYINRHYPEMEVA